MRSYVYKLYRGPGRPLLVLRPLDPNLRSLEEAVRDWADLPPRTRSVLGDRCPECGGELDTGWECNDCGFDGRAIALTAFPDRPL